MTTIRTVHAATARRLVATVMAMAALSVATSAHAQEWLPDAVLIVNTPQVGVLEDASVEVIIPTGMDFPLTLAWGDGTTDYVDHHGALTQAFSHAYTNAGVKVLELLLEDPFENETYLIDTDVIMVGSNAELDVHPTVVDVGEPVTAEVTAGDVGGRLAWGDGQFETLVGGDETFTHAYASAGAYLVELTGPDGTLRAATSVSVATTPLAFDVPAMASVGKEVVGRVTGLAANAPAGARLTWGDGAIDALLDDEVVTHSYVRPGTYVVRLVALDGDRLLALRSVNVEAGGALELPSTAVLFETTRIAASGLAPGLAYEVAFGDGASDVLFADVAGSIVVDHQYARPDARFTVDLTLVADGQRTFIDSGHLELTLPPPTEALQVTQAAIPGVPGLRLTIAASGLLPGVEYLLSGTFGSVQVSPTSPGAGTATVDVYTEGPVDIGLDAVLDVATGGFLTVRRVDATYQAQWIRDETLSVTGPYERILDTDDLTVTASGLQEGFGYDIVVNGDVDRPYRLNPSQAAALSEPGTWTVDLPLVVVGPDVTLELYARLPTGAGIQLDLRAVATVNATVPSGTLALPDPVVPYAVPSPVLVRDLTPGLPYRLQFPGDRVERFTAADDGAADFEFAFGLDQGQLELYVDRDGADARPLATLSHAGVTFVGRMGYTYDVDEFLADGTVTLLVRGVAPGFEYSVTMRDGRRFEGTADENGRLDLDVTHPDYDVFLHMHALDDEFYVARASLTQLPPRQLTFHGREFYGGWVVRVTSLEGGRAADFAEGEDDDLDRPSLSLRDLTGTGTIENFVVGGRLQQPIPVTFQGVDVYMGGMVRSGNASITTPLEVDLPHAVRGVELTFTELVLGPQGEMPVMRGSVTLPTSEAVTFDRVMTRSGYATEGFMVMVGHSGSKAIGASGWSFGPGTFGGAVLDLATTSDYHFVESDGTDALAAAYAGYEEVGRSTPADFTGRWVGVLYPRAELRLDTGGSSFSSYTAHLAWTAAGASTSVAVPLGDGDGTVKLGDWTFHDVTGLELVVVDDQVVRFTRPSGLVSLPWFGQDVPVAFSPSPGALGGWSVRTLAPVATDYGGTAVVGGVGTFVRTGVGTQALRFPNALWALDGDLAADPATVDSSPGDALIASLPEIGTATEDLQEAYDDAVATSETALNLYKLQLLLKDLTLHANGAVDLGGRQWRTLAKVPALDMFGFPYLGAGAEIGVRRDGDSYGIGLRGELKLGDVIEANAAPSWYVHSGGREEQWRFEGVGVKFGDFEGSPVTFSVVVGGVVDLQRLALSFTGAGALTIPDVLSIEALALFGVVEQDGPIPDFFWFVSAGVDLANMGRPINVNIQGVDVLAFYAFRGGIASKLRIDVGGGDCRVDDGNVPELILPSIATNALDCYDPDMVVSFLGGTVIGSPMQGGAGSQGYGIIWHLDTNLVINLGKGGDLQLAGQGWIGKNLDDGYRQRGIEPQQLAGRLVINSSGITGSLCAGPVQATSDVLDCSGLAPARIMVGGLRLAEFKGAMGFTASWSTGQYILALGTMYHPISMYVIPRETSGYFITGYIKQPNILHPNVGLPAGGVWVGANTGFSWNYEKSGKVWPCKYRVYAGAGFGFGGAVGVQAVPSFRLSASINAYAYANAGGRVCGKGLDVGASIRAEGRFAAPNPTEFRGDFHVKIKLPVIKDINVTIRNVGVTIN